MKKFLALLFVLTLGLSAAAFAADSPVLPRPPHVSDVADEQAHSRQVILKYNDQSQAELDALAKSGNEGKTELEYFALSDEDQAKLDALGVDKAALSVDEILHVTLGDYTTKSITFKAAFTVPYPVDTKLAVLMGSGGMPGPYQWSVQNGVVNPDGSVTITLNNFPAEPFLLSILS